MSNGTGQSLQPFTEPAGQDSPESQTPDCQCPVSECSMNCTFQHLKIAKCTHFQNHLGAWQIHLGSWPERTMSVEGPEFQQCWRQGCLAVGMTHLHKNPGHVSWSSITSTSFYHEKPEVHSMVRASRRNRQDIRIWLRQS